MCPLLRFGITSQQLTQCDSTGDPFGNACAGGQRHHLEGSNSKVRLSGLSRVREDIVQEAEKLLYHSVLAQVIQSLHDLLVLSTCDVLHSDDLRGRYALRRDREALLEVLNSNQTGVAFCLRGPCGQKNSRACLQQRLHVLVALDLPQVEISLTIFLVDRPEGEVDVEFAEDFCGLQDRSHALLGPKLGHHPLGGRDLTLVRDVKRGIPHPVGNLISVTKLEQRPEAVRAPGDDVHQ
mmetsp:Transcript_85067/g.177792  ORF Transcript_85067/g.177792 Transcript_85067/m.177792 type:complete len:237 (+) Transcript_85067:933-1643(+)